MKKFFTEHPNSMGETYSEHGMFAFKFGLRLISAGFACIIHAIFPFLFQKTASNLLLETMHQFLDRMPTSDDRERLVARFSEPVRPQ